MRVKINNIWYYSEKEPIVLEITSNDRDILCTMTGRKYFSYPANLEFSDEQIEEILKD